MYTCTKKYLEISVAHRNWRSSTHCALVHGYARSVEITIACDQLDDKEWVMDFGGLRFIKDFLHEQWDHRLLVADDDPLLPEFMDLQNKGALSVNVMERSKGWGPSIELSCRFLADHIGPLLQEKTLGRCWLHKVEIWEKEENRAALLLGRPKV